MSSSLEQALGDLQAWENREVTRWPKEEQEAYYERKALVLTSFLSAEKEKAPAEVHEGSDAVATEAEEAERAERVAADAVIPAEVHEGSSAEAQAAEEAERAERVAADAAIPAEVHEGSSAEAQAAEEAERAERVAEDAKVPEAVHESSPEEASTAEEAERSERIAEEEKIPAEVHEGSPEEAKKAEEDERQERVEEEAKIPAVVHEGSQAAAKDSEEKERKMREDHPPVVSAESAAAKAAVNASVAKLEAPAPRARSGSHAEKAHNSALEKERLEARVRIPLNPGTKGADLRDPDILESYLKMRDDSDGLRWMILGYKKGSNNVLEVLAKGNGQFDEFISHVPDDACYGYINYAFGDTERSKFCFITYVPDRLNGMAKSRILGHRPAVEKFLKYMQIQWHELERDKFKEQTLIDKLLAAGGANYSVQEANKGDFKSYKTTTKEFYAETEKKGSVDIVYHTGPLTTTPVDISGRPSVAAPADFLNNTSTTFKGKK